MMKQIISLLLLGLCLLQSPVTGAVTPGDWTTKVGAKRFPASGKIFWANSYGAVNDSTVLSTAAIQKAIDACSRKGGGIVAFRPGRYMTGSVFVKENVQLRIDKGVELLGSQDFRDYPEIDTRIAGIEMKWPAALINVIGQRNVAITGDGRIDARGKFCWDKYWAMRKDYDKRGLRWIVDYDAKRVRTILLQDAEDVTLKGLTIANAGFWTVQVLYTTRVTITGLTIRNNEKGHGPSTDGIDIDSSSWVLVEHCDIDCNDDDFCLKAGRDWDGLRANRPTEYVVIRKCTARKGGGLLTLGSETSGGIRHVLATDITANGTGNGLNIKSAITRGGVVEDIRFEHARMENVSTVFKFTMNWNPTYSYSKLPEGYNYDSIPDHWKKLLHPVEPASLGTPHFRDVYVSDVEVINAKTAFDAAGMEGSKLEHFQFDQVKIRSAKAGHITQGNGWSFNNVIVQADDSSQVDVQESTNMRLAQ